MDNFDVDGSVEFRYVPDTSLDSFTFSEGGNQRDLARQKNAKKSLEQQKKKAAAEKEGNKGMSLEARKQRDAEQMRIKQMKAQQKTDGAVAGASSN